ncbi:MAG: hypothetical protein LQ348_001207 [Seirophora lacunosa]|nr:MAG: hypothetical protein LQ348_001207 [Seirophora lacunosa]
MAKKRKSTTSASLPATAMDLDRPTSPQPQKSILSANTHSGVSKPTKPLRIPRGKGRRAQRLRKAKASERAEEVRGRTERKVERSKGRGKRRGERNAAWDEMNAKIKGALIAESGVRKGEANVIGEDKGAEEDEWTDEDQEELEHVGESVGDADKVIDGEGTGAAVHSEEMVAMGVDDGVL